MRRGRARTGALALAVALLPLGVATGQQERSAGTDRLILKERVVEITVLENLAILRYDLTVSNPGDRMMEGRVTLDVPSGATGAELSLKHNVASTDRHAKVMEPKRASTLYAVTRARDRRMDEILRDPALGLGGPSLPARKEASRTTADSTPSTTTDGVIDRSDKSTLLTIERPVLQPEPEPEPEPAPTQFGDPAVLE